MVRHWLRIAFVLFCWCFPGNRVEADQPVGSPSPPSPAGAAAKQPAMVLADVAHAAASGERTVLDEGPTGFSRLWAGFRRRPCTLRINREPLAPAVLAGVDVLLLTSVTPGKALTPDELKAVRGLVERGATLLLTNNDLTPAGIAAWAAAAEQFGVQTHGSVLRITGEAQDRRWHVSRYSGSGLARWLTHEEDGPLYFQGAILSPLGGSVLVSYDGNSLAALEEIGKGRAYVFGGGDMIGNALAAPLDSSSYDRSRQSPLNSRLIEALVDEILLPAGKAASGL